MLSAELISEDLGVVHTLMPATMSSFPHGHFHSPQQGRPARSALACALATPAAVILLHYLLLMLSVPVYLLQVWVC